MPRNKHRWWWIVLQTTIQLRNRRNLAPRWLSSRAMHAWGELRGLRSQRIMVDYSQLASTGSWRFFFLIVIITKVDYYYCQYRRKHHHLRENTLQHSDSQLSSSWKIETEVDKKKLIRYVAAAIELRVSSSPSPLQKAAQTTITTRRYNAVVARTVFSMDLR